MAEVRRLFDQQRRARQDALKNAYQSMRADPQWDEDVMDYFLATLAPSKDSFARFREVATSMGTIPSVDGKPSQAWMNEIARFGYVQRNERSLDFMQFHFIDILVGPALFTRWLESRGCSDFRYAFDASMGMGEGDEDESEGAHSDNEKIDTGP
jgi:hypothetical protein